MPKLNIRMHDLTEKKGDVDLDAMMSEFKQALGNDFKLKAFSENTKIGQQLVVAVAGVGEFFCLYELVYNGGQFQGTYVGCRLHLRHEVRHVPIQEIGSDFQQVLRLM